MRVAATRGGFAHVAANVSRQSRVRQSRVSSWRSRVLRRRLRRGLASHAAKPRPCDPPCGRAQLVFTLMYTYGCSFTGRHGMWLRMRLRVANDVVLWTWTHMWTQNCKRGRMGSRFRDPHISKICHSSGCWRHLTCLSRLVCWACSAVVQYNLQVFSGSCQA